MVESKLFDRCLDMASKRARSDEYFKEARKRQDSRSSPTQHSVRSPSQSSRDPAKAAQRPLPQIYDSYRPSDTHRPPHPQSRSHSYENRRQQNTDAQKSNPAISLNTTNTGSLNGATTPTGPRSTTPKSANMSNGESALRTNDNGAFLASSGPLTPASEAPTSPQHSDVVQLLNNLLRVHSKALNTVTQEESANRDLEHATAEFEKHKKFFKGFPAMEESYRRKVKDAESKLTSSQKQCEEESTEQANVLQTLGEKLQGASGNTLLQKQIAELKAENRTLRQEMDNFRTSRPEDTNETKKTLQDLRQKCDGLQHSRNDEAQKLHVASEDLASLKGFREEAMSKFTQLAKPLGIMQARLDSLNIRIEDANAFPVKLKSCYDDIETLQNKYASIEETLWGSKNAEDAEESQDPKSSSLVKWVALADADAKEISMHVNELREKLEAREERFDSVEESIALAASKLFVDTSLEEIRESLKSVHQQVKGLLQDAKQKDSTLDAQFESMQNDIEDVRSMRGNAESLQLQDQASSEIQQRLKTLEERLQQVEVRPNPLSQQYTYPPTPPLAQASKTNGVCQNLELETQELRSKLNVVLEECNNIREVVRFLEDRYNNVTTDEVVQAMIHQTQNLYPLGQIKNDQAETKRFIHERIMPQLNQTPQIMQRITALEASAHQAAEAKAVADSALTASRATNTQVEETSTRIKTLVNENSESLATFRNDTESRVQKIEDTANAGNTALANEIKRLEAMVNDVEAAIESLRGNADELSAKFLMDRGTGEHKILDLSNGLSKLRSDHNVLRQDLTEQINKLSEKESEQDDRITAISSNNSTKDTSEQVSKLQADFNVMKVAQSNHLTNFEQTKTRLGNVEIKTKETAANFDKLSEDLCRKKDKRKDNDKLSGSSKDAGETQRSSSTPYLEKAPRATASSTEGEETKPKLGGYTIQKSSGNVNKSKSGLSSVRVTPSAASDSRTSASWGFDRSRLSPEI